MDALKSLQTISKVFKTIGFIGLIIILFFGIRLTWIIGTVNPVTSTVIQITADPNNEDDTVILTVRYEVDSQIYYATLRTFNKDIFYNDTIIVYPKPDDLTQVYQIQSHIFLIIPAVFSAIFLTVGLSIGPNTIEYERKLERFRQLGKKERAIITKVDHQRWMSVNTMSQTYHPIVISCKKKDSATGIEYIYKTHRLWGFDDSGIVVGESTVIVWIHPNNPSKYVIDINTIRSTYHDPFE
jgi:hypothetical protein